MLPPILLHNYETQTIQLQNQYKLHYKNQISKLPLHTLFPTLIPPNSSMAITTAGKVIRCKAAICRNPGEDLVLEEIEVDPPKAFEVRLRILCTSLCHSDVTFWNMKPPISVFPRILGHEAVGMVESVGEGVEGWEEGEVGLPVFIPDCEECRDCKSAKSNICSKFGMARDGTSRFRDGRGDSVHHFLGVSSFSEYTVVDGVGAAWKAAEVEKGSTVAIFGLGAVGLAVAEGARIRGASKIIGVDLNPAKFELGKKFGLTDFINPKINMNNMAQVIKEMTDGGADYCFECIGLASLMTDAFSSSREGWGKTVIVGIEMHGSPLLVNPYELVRGRSISGTYFGGLKPRTDISILAKKYLDKVIH
ncbi:Alcohol dehydrogenase-like 2 [Linum perenne]